MSTMPMPGFESFFPFAPRVWRAIAAIMRFPAIRRGRRAVADLAACDDRLLADVGIERADLARIFERPMTSDPSAHLALIAQARRHP